MALEGTIAFNFLRDLQASRRATSGFQQVATNTAKAVTAPRPSGFTGASGSQSSSKSESGSITGRSSLQTARGNVDTVNRSFSDGSTSIQYKSPGKSTWVKHSPPDANGMQTVSVRHHTIMANGERIVTAKEYRVPAGTSVSSDGTVMGDATEIRSNKSIKSTSADGTVVWRPWPTENASSQRSENRTS